MNDLALTARQTRFEVRTFWRNPTSAMFTAAFPLIFMIIPAFVKGQNVKMRGHELSYLEVYVPAIVAYALFGACFANLAIRISLLRETGVLKRVNGTPLPKWAYLAGHVLTSVYVSAVLMVVTSVAGRVFYGVTFHFSNIVGILFTLVIGSFCFCSLGLAATSIIANGDAAPGVVNFLAFPQMLVGVFFAADIAGRKGLVWAALRSLPLNHLSNSMIFAYDRFTPAPGINWNDILIMVLWGVAGFAFALRTFRWENRTSN